MSRGSELEMALQRPPGWPQTCKEALCLSLMGQYCWEVSKACAKAERIPNQKITFQVLVTPPIALIRVKNCALICNWGDYTCSGAIPVTYMVKNLPVMQEMWVKSLSQEDLLEKGMATHSIVLAWKFPWAEEPGRLQSMGSQRVRHGWASNTHTPVLTTGSDYCEAQVKQCKKN